MIDSNQIILVLVVVILAILLLVIGIQVFFILRELQRSIQKINKMLDDAGIISESIAKPVASLSKSIASLSGIAGLFGWLAQRKKKREEEAQDE